MTKMFDFRTLSCNFMKKKSFAKFAILRQNVVIMDFYEIHNSATQSCSLIMKSHHFEIFEIM